MKSYGDLGVQIPAEQLDLNKHNGVITIHNTHTGGHRTFKISTIQSGVLEGKRVVSLLSGSDNSNDYTGFAFMGDGGKVLVWKKFRGKGHWETYARMLENPVKWQGKGAQYLISGTCRRCNRRLTHPESIESGFGPDCLKKV